jgi:serine/threonine protein kinase
MYISMQICRQEQWCSAWAKCHPTQPQQQLQVTGQRMPLEDVVSMGRQLAEAVRILHREARIAHFDIKPDNILLDENRTCYLCDFSISLEFPEGQSNLPLPEDGYGSAHYMAPEQVRIIDSCSLRHVTLKTESHLQRCRGPTIDGSPRCIDDNI